MPTENLFNNQSTTGSTKQNNTNSKKSIFENPFYYVGLFGLIYVLTKK